MNKEQTELLERLHQCSLDVAGVAWPFSERLARDNRWSASFAARVISEYKRFAFLAVSAGHPVTPSDAVDQAWHLHLLYTQSYWEDFCGGVLRQPLHHGPTQGGGGERAKFQNWYVRTLTSYRQFFGQEPPADIWPDPVTRMDEIHFARVNTRHHWIVPKPTWDGFKMGLSEVIRTSPERVATSFTAKFKRPGRACAGLLIVALLLALMGCGIQSPRSHSPFALDGKGFLKFYCVAFAATALWAYGLRRAMRKTESSAADAPISLDPFSAAYLAEGPRATVNAAVASLVHNGAISLDMGDKRIKAQKPPQPETSELEQVIHRQVSEGSLSLPEVRRNVEPALSPIRQRLQDAGYLVEPKAAVWGRLVPLLIALVIPMLGIIRIVQGVQREKPVGYLIALTILSLIVALGFFSRRMHRTLKGDQILAGLRKQYLLLRNSPLSSGSCGGSVSLAVGLFGLGVLAHTSLAHVGGFLQPPRSGAGGDSGGGGCGTSGGDGGGCGGGGCGGCGG